jgi:hypothetical protein
VPHPEHSVIIRDMFAMAARGAKPGYIVSIANLSEWPDRYGNTGRWTTTRVMKLLSNRTYLGEIPNGDSTLPGEHAAIVKQEIFDLAQQHTVERRLGNRVGVRTHTSFFCAASWFADCATGR